MIRWLRKHGEITRRKKDDVLPNNRFTTEDMVEVWGEEIVLGERGGDDEDEGDDQNRVSEPDEFEED